MNSHPSFGERMNQLRAERGIKPTGRKAIVEKYAGLTRAAERTFANALPEQAGRYVDELAPREPERCPNDDHVMQCPECGLQSQRTHYDHKAAQYLFDRILGKPTSRSENVITVRLVEQLTGAFVAVFGEVNAIDDPGARREAFAAKLALIGGQFGGSAA